MKSEIRIKNNSEEGCRIEIEGTIGVPEEWQFDEEDARIATYEKFRSVVAQIGDIEAREIVVDIRSTGGDVNDALLIYDALRQTGARITTRCYGYTASAATIIAQAADEGCRLVSANSLYLIHTSVCATEGNAAELEAKSELLRQTDERIAAIYAARSGRDAAEFTALMNENGGNGRWLSPEECVTAGLADGVIGEKSEPERSVKRDIVSGWERLMRCVGLQRGEEFPSDRNVLHFERNIAAARLEERRSRLAPTGIMQREDPSCRENLRSANEQAYAEDVLRFKKQ